MKPSLCLFTDSPEPSGLGVHMLTLAAELQERYRISFVCPPTLSALPLFERAWKLGLETLPLDVRLGGKAAKRLQRWLRARQIMVFHDHAGISWEGHYAIEAARAAKVPVVVRTGHLPYLVRGATSGWPSTACCRRSIVSSWFRKEHARPSSRPASQARRCARCATASIHARLNQIAAGCGRDSACHRTPV